jgi:hypothetical protein
MTLQAHKVEAVPEYDREFFYGLLDGKRFHVPTETRQRDDGEAVSVYWVSRAFFDDKNEPMTTEGREAIRKQFEAWQTEAALTEIC